MFRFLQLPESRKNAKGLNLSDILEAIDPVKLMALHDGNFLSQIETLC